MEALTALGAEARFVGSYRCDLMYNKDIDIHVYTDELNVAATLSALSPLFSNPRTKRCVFINGADTDEFCLEWHLVMTAEDGEI